MSTWNSRGLRGSAFEELVNYTNEYYKDKALALVQKIPTPITPMKFDKETHHITLAYFDQQSTVDYIGVAQGVPICFDAKECVPDRFTLQNVHPHQVDFMKRFEEQEGIAFLLIHFVEREKYYYMPYRELEVFWNRMLEGGRKSFLISELKEKFFFPDKIGMIVPYLDMINVDIDDREIK